MFESVHRGQPGVTHVNRIFDLQDSDHLLLLLCTGEGPGGRTYFTVESIVVKLL